MVGMMDVVAGAKAGGRENRVVGGVGKLVGVERVGLGLGVSARSVGAPRRNE
jgi:hypothetical protein